jgi:YrbI family 3-deoxy-D-manno-octulosonate 8-phosphate phosphatase
MSDKVLSQRSPKVKMVAMDCDGVLTDGGMYYSETGDELKKFNTRDGMGIKLLHQRNLKTAIITGEDTKIVANRAEKLSIKDVYLGVEDKVQVMARLLEKYHLNWDEVAYVGDDVNDMELLKKSGLSFSVSDGMECVKKIVHHVTKTKGGQGAIREIAEIILSNQRLS